MSSYILDTGIERLFEIKESSLASSGTLLADSDFVK